VKHQGHWIRARAAKPASGISVDSIRNSEDDHDRGFGESVAPQFAHQEREVIRRDGIKMPNET
jgi:hypothetical protein